MNYYVHDLSPMAVEWGWFILPWYWLSYIFGFFIVYIGMMNLSAKGQIKLSKKMTHDYLSMGFFSLILGGRLGYILIYNLGYYIKDPMKVFALWEGGMSFHGALIGIGIYTLYKSKKSNTSFLTFTDAISIFSPVGIFFGRVSNFINGELAGRVTDVPWAVIFPKFYNGEPRHPSQLYEALGYLAVSLLGFYLYERFHKTWPEGRFVGIILLLGMSWRFFTEFFKDNQVAFEEGMLLNMGQLLSVPMAILGLILIFRKQIFGAKKAS